MNFIVHFCNRTQNISYISVMQKTHEYYCLHMNVHVEQLNSKNLNNGKLH